MKHWEEYHQHVSDVPNHLVVGCLNDFVTRRVASLDLGAGNLRDSKYLLGKGFTRVVAVDASEASRTFLTEGIELHIAEIEAFVPDKDVFDFAFSCNTLFFLTPEKIAQVFQNVYDGLRSGGIFACNVLGQEDGWVVQGERVSSFTERTLTALATDFEVLGLGESKEQSHQLSERGLLLGKLWHQLSIAVRKP